MIIRCHPGCLQDCCLATGWSLPKACDKPVLPAAVSVVLAFLLLELRDDLCHDCLLLHPKPARLNLGEPEAV